MLIGHDERVPIARLLTFLEHGERMAHDCAKAQAVSHHGFGRRQLERAMIEGRVDAKTLRCRAERYLVLTDQMVLALSDLFESIAEDPAAWAQDVRIFLPEWLQEEPIAVSRA
jgi:hypothetical protein